MCNISNNLDRMEDDYLIMDQNDKDCEDEIEFCDVPEDKIEDEHDALFILTDNVFFLSS